MEVMDIPYTYHKMMIIKEPLYKESLKWFRNNVKHKVTPRIKNEAFLKFLAELRYLMFAYSRRDLMKFKKIYQDDKVIHLIEMDFELDLLNYEEKKKEYESLYKRFRRVCVLLSRINGVDVKLVEHKSCSPRTTCFVNFTHDYNENKEVRRRHVRKRYGV